MERNKDIWFQEYLFIHFITGNRFVSGNLWLTFCSSWLKNLLLSANSKAMNVQWQCRLCNISSFINSSENSASMTRTLRECVHEIRSPPLLWTMQWKPPVRTKFFFIANLLDKIILFIANCWPCLWPGGVILLRDHYRSLLSSTKVARITMTYFQVK